MRQPQFPGRTALVTGASRGIGRAVAQVLGDAGCRVAIVSRGAADLDAAAAELRLGGAEVEAFACDVADEAAVAALAQQVGEQFGGVDFLINNAGSAESAPFLQTDRALWERTLAINLTSAFLVTRAFLPGMLQRGFGRVVFVASVAGKVGHPYVTAYCAAKHGVIGLTKALALEVAAKGVTVNAVCPSYVDTPMTDRSIANIVARTGRSVEEAREALLSRNPQHRLIEVDEVAACVTYLLSDGARGVNGQAINLCGGMTPL